MRISSFELHLILRNDMSEPKAKKIALEKSSKVSPKAKMKDGLLRLGGALASIVQGQKILAKMSMEEQNSKEVMYQKLRIYESAIPDLFDAFERLAEPILAKQAGGRPPKGEDFSTAYDMAEAHFKKTGRDLSAEQLSLKVSRLLMANNPNAYKKCLGWDAIGEEDIPRPFPTRTASTCLFTLKLCRPHEK
jgi:hypothetical protein